MNYFRRTMWDKHLPMALGLLFFAISLSTIAWLTRNIVIFGTRAAVGSVPQNIRISNITDASFTVTYTTTEKVPGTVTYGRTTEFGSLALDDRDQQQGQSLPYRVHSITLDRLEPSTRYYFALISGTDTVQDGNVPFEVVTAPTVLQKPKERASLSGEVTLAEGGFAAEAMAYLSGDNAQLVSVLIKPDGSFTVPLTGIRNKDLSSFFEITPRTTMQLLLTTGTLQTKASVLPGKTSSLPPMLFAQDYDFTFTTVLSTTGEATSSGTRVFPTQTDSFVSAASSGPQILTPETNESFKDQQPLFEGIATPNAEVEITIHSSQEITVTVQADANGRWEYRPEEALDPGAHTITVITQDITGALKTLSQGFTVYASGSEFIEPSVEPTAAPTETPAPTPTEVPPIPTPTPTEAATPTPSRILGSPTPSAIMTQPPVPQAGNETIILSMMITSIIIGSGALLLFTTRGGLRK